MRIILSSVALVAMFGIGSTMAEAQSQRAATSADMRTDRDNGFDMGWLGLVGLVGLLGMKRSDARDRVVTRTDSGVSSTTR
jgi:hypothetical protein